jgi:hypothetical protein
MVLAKSTRSALLALLTLAVAGAQHSALAQTDGTSTTKAEENKKSILDNFRANYWGMYSGSGLTFRGYHPDQNGKPAGPIGSWNQLNAGYRFTPNFQAEAQMIFDWKISGGQALSLLNPRVGLSGTAYNQDGLFVWFNLNAELPTSEGAIRDGLITSVGGFQEIVYNLPNTKTDLVFWNWTRFYAYQNGLFGQTIAGGVQPTVRYALTRTFKPLVTLEIPYQLNRPANGGQFITNSAILRPGFSWDVTSRINVMPYLMIRPAAPVTADSTALGMWLSGTIL